MKKSLDLLTKGAFLSSCLHQVVSFLLPALNVSFQLASLPINLVTCVSLSNYRWLYEIQCKSDSRFNQKPLRKILDKPTGPTWENLAVTRPLSLLLLMSMQSKVIESSPEYSTGVWNFAKSCRLPPGKQSIYNYLSRCSKDHRLHSYHSAAVILVVCTLNGSIHYDDSMSQH